MHLNPGETICQVCDGSGHDEKYEKFLHEYRDYYKCPNCHGTGKLDWIENIVGKKDEPNLFNGVTWMAPGNLPPPNPVCGQAYINTSCNKVFIYDGAVWVEVDNHI